MLRCSKTRRQNALSQSGIKKLLNDLPTGGGNQISLHEARLWPLVCLILISRNSRSVRLVYASSTDPKYHRCSGRRKSRAGRNSAIRRHTRNSWVRDQYTRDVDRGAPYAANHFSGHRAAGCCSAADDSQARNRSRASVTPTVCGLARPARRPKAATEQQRLKDKRGAPYVHNRQSASGRPFKIQSSSLPDGSSRLAMQS
jgi:hypothetical protein